MHGPSDDDAKRKRELARLRQRRKRARDKIDPVVIEALILRSIDSGVTEAEAERTALDAKKVAADLAEINLEWARRYIKQRDRT